MNDRLRHRGPDHSAIYAEGPVALGHTRLSILDLSDRANQPFPDGSGRYHIVFNGELYNFKTLRNELEGMGARFRTSSDTEVVLEAFKAWGADCLSRFNGMFAFAIWDTDRQRLFMARDRLGKKPLYFFRTPDGGIVFASELKALQENPDIPREISGGALGQYLSLNYVLGSGSIIRGVEKLQPGHYLVAGESGDFRQTCYWDLAACFRDKAHYNSLDDAMDDFTELFDDATRLRMVSDVPLGAFLSGGLDSSSIVAMMGRHRTPGELKTFSIDFDEEGFSEISYAKTAAEHLGVDFRRMTVTPDLMTDYADIVYAADEPFADTSMIPMYYLARFARENVTVALSGDGCDEIMAGYKTYTADRIHAMTRMLPSWFFRSMHSLVTRLPADYGKVSFNYKLRHFLNGAAEPSPCKAHYLWRLVASPDRVRNLLPEHARAAVGAADPSAEFSRFEKDVKDCHYLDRSMYVDIKTWLADDILVKVDRMTMAHSLEARAPFLDYRLVEFAARLPVKYKMRLFEGKYLVRKAMAKALPPAIIRRRKAGFNSPISHWVAHPLRELVDRIGEPFDARQVKRLYEEHLQKRRDNGLTLMALINFDLWQKAHGRLPIH